MRKTAPLVCTIGTMSAAVRRAHAVLAAKLKRASVEVKALPNGAAIRFAAEPSIVCDLASFVSVESQCCRFLRFDIEVGENQGPVWLRITGPAAAKPIIMEMVRG